MDDGKIIIKAQIDSSEVDSGLSKVEGKVNKSANNLMGILKGVGITALVAKASQVAIKFAKEVNTQTEAISTKLKAASTLYQGVAVDQEKLLKNLSEISSETGADLETLGQSVYDALSAGVKPTEDMADVLKVVEASAKLAKGGFTDTSTALSSTMKVMNAYSMEMKDLDRVQGILVQTQNSGITTVDELGASLAQVVPTAASFGVSFENVGAAIAEMTKQGTKTAQATTSLNAIIAELGKNGTKASKALEESAKSAGMADTDFKSMLESGMNISEILQLMSDYASKNGLSMVDMFSSIEAGKGSLQLTGKAGDDFNEIMAQMGESAGLVQDAFEKTVDPSERLTTAWNNFLVTIGAKFKPTADGVRTTLADMITKLSSQSTASDDLNTSIDRLVTASNNLKTAQSELEKSVNDTTIALKAQTRIEYLDALDELGKDFEKTKKLISGMSDSFDDMTNSIDVQKEELNGLYEEYSGLFGGGSTLEDWVNNAIDADVTTLDREGKRVRSLVIEFTRDIADLEVQRDKLSQNITSEETKQSDAIKALAQAVNEGTLNIRDIKIWNAELAKSVEDAIPALEKEAEALEKVSESGSGEKGSAKENSQIEETVDLYKELLTEHNAILDSYNKLEEASNENGLSLYDESQKLSDLTSLYIKYAKLGLDPASTQMEMLSRQIKELTPDMEEQEEVVSDLSDEVNSIVEKYALLQDADEKLGTTMYNDKAMADELRKKLEEYVEKGVDPASDAMKTLCEWLEYFDNKANGATGSITELSDQFKSMGKSATTSLAQSVGNVFEEFEISCMTAENRLKEVEKEIKKIGDETSGSLKDAIDEVAIAEQELTIATKRGDSIAIANAQKKVDKAKELRDGLEEQKEILETQKKTIENNSDSWSNLGKSSLEALASILEGLAAQLAAMAVSTYPNMAQMSLSALGSGIAYAAAGLLRGRAQQFENGGIVKGTSYTGDRTWVRANAGELIMNMSQQETMARILEASVAMAELNAINGTGNGITVNLEGASIYGLDEPSVGKAIYENIEQLKYEGVI